MARVRPAAGQAPWARCRRAGPHLRGRHQPATGRRLRPLPAGLIKKIGGEKVFDRLTSVTVNPEGTLIYAVDIGGVDSDKHVVKVFDGGDRRPQDGYRQARRRAGEFNLPRDLAIGKDGRLYVVDGGNFRVVVFDRDGKYLQSFGSVGRQLGQFSRPKEIAADPQGNIYVVDSAFGNFQIFNADGELLMFVGTRDEPPIRRAATCCRRASPWTEDGRGLRGRSGGSARSTCTGPQGSSPATAFSADARPRHASRCSSNSGRIVPVCENKTFRSQRSDSWCVGNSDAKALRKGQIPTIGNGTPFALVLAQRTRSCVHEKGEGRENHQKPGRGNVSVASCRVLHAAGTGADGHFDHQAQLGSMGWPGRTRCRIRRDLRVLPHAARADTTASAPLWNKRLPSGFGLHGLQHRELDHDRRPGADYGGLSVDHLSVLHDGTQAMDNIINAPGSGGYVADGGGAGGRAYNWGTSPRVDHERRHDRLGDAGH